MSVLAVLAVRGLLVMLFFPFSLLDKLLNFHGAVAQAEEMVPHRPAIALILAGIAVETLGPLAILTGTADRAAGLLMAGYCMVTALLWKRFWVPGDFWRRGDSKARGLFWDFLKNFSLAGGFLLLVVGAPGSAPDGGLLALLHDPLGSSHPYTRATTPTGVP